MSETIYVIRDRAGTPLALHRRIDLPDGRKSFPWEPPPGKAPNGAISSLDKLYGLELLDAHPEVSTVVLCEGEKSADALNRVGFLALATVCGATSIPTDEVLANLAGRRVILWPDADPAPDPQFPDRFPRGKGRWHMEQIGTFLRGIGVEVNMLTWPEAPTKGDAADLVMDGMGPEDVKLVVVLEPFEPPPSEDGPQDDGRPDRLQVEGTNPKTWLLHWPGVGVQRLTSALICGMWGPVQTAFVEQFERTPLWTPSRSDPWTTLVSDLMDAMGPDDHIEPPPELTVAGRTLDLLTRLCGTEPPDDPGDPRAQAGNLDRGEPWWELETGRVYFRFAVLYKRHQQDSLPGDRLTRPQIRLAIEELGGDTDAPSLRPNPDGSGRRWMQRLSWVPWSVLDRSVNPRLT